ncbi:MAG: proline dehydrogenase family protein [Bdellovibrionota bacterium]
MKIPIVFARRFVAGETADQAIEVVKILNQEGIKTSLDLLGENVENLQQADAAVQEYRELFDKIAAAGIDSGVSIKLTQLGLDFGLDACLERTSQVLQMAQEKKLFVRIDMEGSHYTQITIDAFLALLKDFDRVGIVLQAYLKRSMQDVANMANHHASVRVCKGAYKESESIAYHSMDEIRAQYKAMVMHLLQAKCTVGIATHDDKLIDWAVAWVEENKIDRSLFEFQMLYGLRRNKAKELVAKGYRVRSYVPYGTHWFPYFYRRLRERKENIFFVLKGLLVD